MAHLTMLTYHHLLRQSDHIQIAKKLTTIAITNQAGTRVDSLMLTSVSEPVILIHGDEQRASEHD